MWKEALALLLGFLGGAGVLRALPESPLCSVERVGAPPVPAAPEQAAVTSSAPELPKGTPYPETRLAPSPSPAAHAGAVAPPAPAKREGASGALGAIADLGLNYAKSRTWAGFLPSSLVSGSTPRV